MTFYEEEIQKNIDNLEKEGRLSLTKGFIQHGNVSVYEHCLEVCVCSIKIARMLRIRYDLRALIRGALLHDYFLYDWHVNDDPNRKLHGFFHPSVALENALKDYELSKKEQDIIKHHMFPLTIIPPMCREAWLVCLADKICAGKETLLRRQ